MELLQEIIEAIERAAFLVVCMFVTIAGMAIAVMLFWWLAG